MIRSAAVALIAAVSAGPAPAGPSAGGLADLVAEGEQWWTRSPDPRDPVACATCHHDPDETRGWAASFPKLRPLPPPEGRVMTLLQANAEAVQRHYGLPDPERAALAITAYLTSRGTGVPVSPGITAGQPVFESRLRTLAESVGRGARIYARRCSSCHDPGAVAPAALLFPRVVNGRVESLERFLGGHRPELPTLQWDGQPAADVIAFLMSALAGRPVLSKGATSRARPQGATAPSFTDSPRTRLACGSAGHSAARPPTPPSDRLRGFTQACLGRRTPCGFALPRPRSNSGQSDALAVGGAP